MDHTKKPTLGDRAKELAKKGAEKGADAGIDAALDSQLTEEEKAELKDKSTAEKAAVLAEKEGEAGLDYLKENEQVQDFWNTYCGCLGSAPAAKAS